MGLKQASLLEVRQSERRIKYFEGRRGGLLRRYGTKCLHSSMSVSIDEMPEGILPGGSEQEFFR